MTKITYITQVSYDTYLEGLIRAANVQPHCMLSVLEVLGGLDLATAQFSESLTKEGEIVRTEEYSSTEDLRAMMKKHGNWVENDGDSEESDDEPTSRLH